MADHDNKQQPDEGSEFDNSFSPSGTLFLMIFYITLFAAAWSSVYFFEFLARR